MLKKAWSLVALAALGSVVFANVDLRTNINDVYYRGSCEEAGAVTMSVNGDDFREASTDTPIYIRVRLMSNATLCQTLVGCPAVHTLSDPIYLAVRLEGVNPGAGSVTLNVHEEAVSIVRWIAGERSIWLRVQQASSDWIDRGAITFPPTSEFSVAWTFGLTELQSLDENDDLFAADLANRDSNSWGTKLCVNLSAATINPYPANDSILVFDTISWNWQTEPMASQHCAPEEIVWGQQAGVNFSGDDSIARGYDVECWVSAAKNEEIGRAHV